MEILKSFDIPADYADGVLTGGRESQVSQDQRHRRFWTVEADFVLRRSVWAVRGHHGRPHRVVLASDGARRGVVLRLHFRFVMIPALLVCGNGTAEPVPGARV